jgi:hypothetical protein
MFNPEESVSVTPDKAGYHSLPLSTVLNGEVNLLLPSFKHPKDYKTVSSDKLLSVALNPIEGWCRDVNCKAFRNFLFEIDVGPIDSQLEYIKRSGIPTSAIVFSGNKSIHVLVSLSEDLSDENTWRKINLWVLNILPLLDQNCKNPSRKIRIPGAEREPGKFQQLIEFKGKVQTKDLADWLYKHRGSCPQEKPKRKPAGEADLSLIKPWASKLLNDGITSNRNHNWFSVAVEFAAAGIFEEEAIEMLEQYFTPERDFKEREWLTAIASGYRYLNDKKD